MANRRMIAKELSYSESFNSVSEFAQLLYLIITPHLDDFGKIEGNPNMLRARVIPLSKRSPRYFEAAIKELYDAGLIDWYEVNSKKVIRYLNFEEDQTGLDKRTKSKYPDNPNNSKNFTEVLISSSPTEPNRTYKNLTELNKSEPKKIKKVADINIAPYKRSIGRDGGSYPDSEEVPNTDEDSSSNSHRGISPKTFDPQSNEELQALETWKRLEPDNLFAFYPTYLSAVKKGLPAHKFGEFASEIEQDPSIKNRGSVFNKKVSDYIESQNNNKGGENNG